VWPAINVYDGVCVEQIDGTSFALMTLASNHPNERESIPYVPREILAGLKATI
jgi:hypothetical protein